MNTNGGRTRWANITSIAIVGIAAILATTLASLSFVGKDQGIVSRPPNSSPAVERLSTYKIAGLKTRSGCEVETRANSFFFDGYYASVASGPDGILARVLVEESGAEPDEPISGTVVSTKQIEFGLQLRSEIRGGSLKLRRSLSKTLLEGAFLQDPHVLGTLIVDWPNGFYEVGRGVQEVHGTTRYFSDRELRVLRGSATPPVQAWYSDWIHEVSLSPPDRINVGIEGIKLRPSGDFVEVSSNGSSTLTKTQKANYEKRVEPDPSCFAIAKSWNYLRAGGSLDGDSWTVASAAAWADGFPGRTLWKFRDHGSDGPTWNRKGELYVHIFTKDRSRFLAFIAPPEAQTVRVLNPDGTVIPAATSKSVGGPLNAFLINAANAESVIVIELLDAKGHQVLRRGFRYASTRQERYPFSLDGLATPLPTKGDLAYAPPEIEKWNQLRQNMW
jgi:hypothetical protein